MINDARIRAILQAQEHIESSGGKNVDHPEVTYGMHKGTSAKGRYGIMPSTLKDLAQNMTKDKEAQEAAAIQDEERLKEYFSSHPKLEDRLAMQYIKQANKSMGGDYNPDKITYAWQWGQNKTAEDFERDKNKPEVQERLAKLKRFLNDPYPPQGPKQLPEQERMLAQEPVAEPSPQPNLSPFIEETQKVAQPVNVEAPTETQKQVPKEMIEATAKPIDNSIDPVVSRFNEDIKKIKFPKLKQRMG